MSSCSPVAAKRITKSAASAWVMKCLVPVITQSTVAAVADGAGAHAAQVRARLRLGHRQALDALARHRRQQVGRALVALAGQQDPRRPRDGQHLQRVAGVPELALHQHPGERVEPAAARPPRACWRRRGRPGSPCRAARRSSPGSSTPLRSTSSSCGTSSRCTNARVVSTTARCSAVSSRSTRSPHGDAAGRVLRRRHQQRLGARPQRRRGTGSPAPRPCRRGP